MIAICNFVTVTKEASVDEAIPEQQHISEGVQSWANLKQAYDRSVAFINSQKMMGRRICEKEQC